VLFCIIVAVLHPLPAGAEEGPKRPKDLLARYEAFVDGLRVIAFDSLEMQYSKGGPFKDWTWTSSYKSSYARAGQRWRLRVHQVGLNYYQRILPLDVDSENVFDGETYVIVNRDDRGARSLSKMDLDTAKRRLESGGAGPVETDVLAEVDAQKPTGAGEYAIQEQTSVLYGYISVDQLFVTDLLRDKSTRLTSGSEAIEGRSCDILKGLTTHGTVTLWLDSSSDYAPVRIHLRKSGNDLMDKIPMRLQKAPNYMWARPNLPTREYELHLDARPVSIDGRTALAGYVRRDLFVYEGGSEYSIRSDAVFDNVRLLPKPGDLEPTLPIPEETRVSIRNAPGLQAKWSGGKIVMLFDKPTVASLKANWVSEQSSPPLWRRPLVLAALTLLVLAAALLFRRSLPVRGLGSRRICEVRPQDRLLSSKAPGLACRSIDALRNFIIR
jgi:hypothetical protein